MVPKVKGSKPLFHPKEYLEAGLSIAQLLCFNPNQPLGRKMKKIKGGSRNLVGITIQHGDSEKKELFVGNSMQIRPEEFDFCIE